MISARTSAATTQRARQLGITVVRQGVPSKLRAYDEILQEHRLSDADVAYMGDDVLDLPIMARAGLCGCPADGVEEVRSRADYVSRAVGGDGAAREFVELVLKAQGRWKKAVPQAIAYYAALAKQGEVVYRASPYAHGENRVGFDFDWSFDYYPLAYYRPGPEMTVYRLHGGRCKNMPRIS